MKVELHLLQVFHLQYVNNFENQKEDSFELNEIDLSVQMTRDNVFQLGNTIDIITKSRHILIPGKKETLCTTK